jgi:nucleobase:cation symporter-1, NCS1 family
VRGPASEISAIAATEAKAFGIEVHSIDYIERTERHGNVRDQAPFWFTGNLQFLSISVGFIGPSNGLSFGWTSVAGILGIMFGTLFMAFHATQGPVLGLPQMVQSRAQFGYRGVIVPLVGALINFGGMNVVCALLIMAGLHNLFGWNAYLVLALTALPSLILALYGYDWLHRVFKLLFWVSLPLIGILTLAIAAGMVPHHVPAGTVGFSAVAFGVQFAAAASYNIAFAPYVSDYSRYLKHDTKASSLIAAVFIGASSSASWLIVVGAWLATHLTATDPLVAVSSAGNAILHGFGTVLAIDSVLVLLAVVSIDTYSGMLTLVTAFDSIRPIEPTRAVRAIFVSAITVLWVSVALIGGQNAIAALTLALTIILYMLVPWTAVNLVDFFFVRRGHYKIRDLFNPRGIYGRWAWRGLLAYALGWFAIMPFAVLPNLWIGALAARLGGVDIGWLVGLLVAGASYYLFSKRISVNVEQIAAFAKGNASVTPIVGAGE